MLLWKWRARRAIKPLIEEREADSERVDAGTEAWLRWWRGGGERELRCILMVAWDPIGVSDAPEAWDEYDDYAPGVAHRLRDAANVDEAVERVAEYLDHVERDFMEISTKSRRANRHLAESLVAWYDWSHSRDASAVRSTELP